MDIDLARFGKLVLEINPKINEGMGFEQILDFMFDSLALIIPFDRIGLALLDEGDGTVSSKWVRAKVPVKHLSHGYSAPLKGSSLAAIIESGEPRIINDLTAYAAEHPSSESTKLILRDGIRSSLTCPLKTGERAVGFIFFSSCETYTYGLEHVGVFKAIAAELSVIVEQGRLRRFFSENESRSQNLRMILHDLRSPLSVIQGYLDFSEGEDWYRALDPHARGIFAILRKNTNFMFQLLTELSEFNHLQSGVEKLEMDEVDVPGFCAEVAERAQMLAMAKDIVFSSSIGDLPSTARFDSEKLRRVFDNLFTNAVKFSDRGGSLRFTAAGGQGKLSFKVSDKGRGIAESEMELLFKEFGKTSTRPTEGESSTGLGLAIARKIVERHGGGISVTSRPGEGSDFMFWIPSRSSWNISC